MKSIRGIGHLDIGLLDYDYDILMKFCKYKNISLDNYKFGYSINMKKKKYSIDFYNINLKREYAGEFYVDTLFLLQDENILKIEEVLR